MSFTQNQYNSTGFSMQRDEIISIQQPKNTEIFYVSDVKTDFALSEKIDQYLNNADKIRIWINDMPVEPKLADGSDVWTFKNTVGDFGTVQFTNSVWDAATDADKSHHVRIEYFRDTRDYDNPSDLSTNYEDGLLRKLARDMVLNPYEITNGAYNVDTEGKLKVAQPYNLIYPHYVSSCKDSVGVDMEDTNEDSCVENGGTWSADNRGTITIDTDGRQVVKDVLASINTIDNMFVVESEKGTDILSSIKDVTNSTSTIPAPDGSQPAGLSVKRKPQKWRIRFYYDTEDNYLHVNVGTKYQILDNGKITNTERRDGIGVSSMRLPGEMCDIYLDPQTESLKGKSGFFRRQGKETSEYEGTYPMSYRLSTTDHGTVFYMWDHASVGQDDDYAWFVVQRHVDNRTGRIDLEDGYSPVHCVYSPAKRPINIGDKQWFQDSNLNDAAGTVFNQSGAEFTREDVSIIKWRTQSNVEFGGDTRNDVFYLAGDNTFAWDGTSAITSGTSSTTGTGLVTKPVGPDVTTVDWWAAKHVQARLDPAYISGTDSYAYAFDAGGNYPYFASDDIITSNFSKIFRPDRMLVTAGRKNVERARKEEYFLDQEGKVVWNLDQFNWSGTSRNSYVYDPIEHKLVFRNALDEGTEVEVRYYNYKSQSSSLDTYMIEIPQDPELPEYNLNINKEGKAIYRFIVREADVFKPWDVHKSATMTQVDSPAIINPMEQMSITQKRRFIYTFPTPLVTQRFVYATSELDLISYSSADSSAFSGQALIGSGNNQKYTFDRVKDIEGTFDGGTDKLDFRAPYDWHSYRCSVGSCDVNGTVTENVDKSECTGDWTDKRQVYGWSGNYLDYTGASVADGVTATNSADCIANGGNWTTPSRVYQGMMSTQADGNGMRIFMLVRGGPINPDYSDVVVVE